jgi:hypothetical protein
MFGQHNKKRMKYFYTCLTLVLNGSKGLASSSGRCAPCTVNRDSKSGNYSSGKPALPGLNNVFPEPNQLLNLLTHKEIKFRRSVNNHNV